MTVCMTMGSVLRGLLLKKIVNRTTTERDDDRNDRPMTVHVCCTTLDSKYHRMIHPVERCQTSSSYQIPGLSFARAVNTFESAHFELGESKDDGMLFHCSSTSTSSFTSLRIFFHPSSDAEGLHVVEPALSQPFITDVS